MIPAGAYIRMGSAAESNGVLSFDLSISITVTTDDDGGGAALTVTEGEGEVCAEEDAEEAAAILAGYK